MVPDTPKRAAAHPTRDIKPAHAPAPPPRPQPKPDRRTPETLNERAMDEADEAGSALLEHDKVLDMPKKKNNKKE